VAEAKAAAHYVTKNFGGRGAVREAVELVLRAQKQMATVRGKIFRMKLGARKIYLVLAAGICLSALNDRAQQIPVGHATDFTSDSYFEPPNEHGSK